MYSHTVFPDRHEACGVRLLPLTLGHALLLNRLGSPFARSNPVSEVDGTIFTYPDVLLCAFVCSRPWRASERQVDSLRAQLWIRFKFSARRWWRKNQDALGLLKWHQAMWAQPEAKAIDTGKPKAALGAEWLQVLRVFACDHLNCNPTTALDQHIATLQYDYLCVLERDGKLQMTEAENEILMRLCENDQEVLRA